MRANVPPRLEISFIGKSGGRRVPTMKIIKIGSLHMGERHVTGWNGSITVSLASNGAVTVTPWSEGVRAHGMVLPEGSGGKIVEPVGDAPVELEEGKAVVLPNMRGLGTMLSHEGSTLKLRLRLLGLRRAK